MPSQSKPSHAWVLIGISPVLLSSLASSLVWASAPPAVLPPKAVTSAAEQARSESVGADFDPAREPAKESAQAPAKEAAQGQEASTKPAAPPKGAAAPAKTPPPKVPLIVSITKVVGEVGEQVITSREVRINDAIEQVVEQKPPGPEGYRVLSGQEKTFPGEVSRILDEWVIYLEARSFSTTPVARAEVARVMKDVQEKWGSQPAWQELEASSEEVRAIIERKLIAKEFERLKSTSSLVPVSDADALAYYKKNRLRFGSLPFSSFKENIKEFLVKQQTERRLAEWHEVLRRKYKVRNFISG